jgi:hypothetical protein
LPKIIAQPMLPPEVWKDPQLESACRSRKQREHDTGKQENPPHAVEITAERARRPGQSSPRAPAAFGPSDDLGPKPDQEDDRDDGGDNDPSSPGGFAEEEVATESQGHRARW